MSKILAGLHDRSLHLYLACSQEFWEQNCSTRSCRIAFLRITHGQRSGLVGPNGTSKSTLLVAMDVKVAVLSAE
jgi:ABC-type polysaccharide/polyol phosphate transport system ATPase subunit